MPVMRLGEDHIRIFGALGTSKHPGSNVYARNGGPKAVHLISVVELAVIPPKGGRSGHAQRVSSVRCTTSHMRHVSVCTEVDILIPAMLNYGLFPRETTSEKPLTPL